MRVRKGVFREPWMPIFNCRESWKNEINSRNPWHESTPVIRDTKNLFLEIREHGL